MPKSPGITMTERQAFVELLRGMGVRVVVIPDLDKFDEKGIYVADSAFKFTEQGEFVGVKTGGGPPNFEKRLPAPEH